ncbi:glycosyltransferase family 2 protein [Microbacterium sp. ZW T5_56]|uniref:glycosyltransferase family 2 protein n=1 Tax=Microbacterium sp. ZW T5_56 TaxID=3378081 RepID=UPI003853ECC6
MRIVVAIPTFRRPELLAALLAVLPQRFAELDPGDQAAVLVVDNDSGGSAAPTVAESGLSARFVVETGAGVAHVRNRALDEADNAMRAIGETGADVLVFIDDDEVPEPGWLRSLVDTWRAYDCAAVMGTVRSVLPADLDPWLVATGTFRRATHATGTEMPAAATGNLLLDLSRVRRVGARFDPRLSLTGGEDTLFTRALVRAGERIVWCAESVAVDTVVPERLTRAWARERAYMRGNATVHIALLEESVSSRIAALRCRFAITGTARIISGLLMRGAGRLASRPELDARGWRVLHRGRGMLGGARGHVHRAYARDRQQTP